MKDLCTNIEKHSKTLDKLKVNMYKDESIKQICDLLKVISEPARLKIILALNEGELCVNHIVEAVNGNQSAVSHQLKTLKQANLVKSRREGKTIYYSLSDDHVKTIFIMAKDHIEE